MRRWEIVCDIITLSKKGVAMTMIKDFKNIQYVTDKDGKNVSVLLPIEEFEALLEYIDDLKVIAQRKDEEKTSMEDFLAELESDEYI